MASAGSQSSHRPNPGGDSVKSLIKFDCEDGKLRFDIEAFKKVLGQKRFENHKVAVYSAIGTKRSGKSTFLTFFNRHADLSRIPRSEIIDDENELLSSTFEWRGGKIPVTKGIYICKHPIEFSLEDGNKAAVFLMDTQGMFDPDISTQEQKMLGAVTFLISSKQFFHEKREIETDHLDLVYDCAKLAEEIQNKDHQCNHLQKQSLTCVVHDWETDDNCELGFNGGKKHLKNVTDGAERQAVEHKLRKEYFDKIFGKVSCFLLPPPKKAIRRMNEASRRLLVKEFGQNFLTTLDELLKHEFQPDQLMLKQIDGNSMTCKELCDHLTLHAENINSSEQLQECLKHDRVRKADNEIEELIRSLLGDFVDNLWEPLYKAKKDKNTHQAIFDQLFSNTITKFDCKRKSKVEPFVNKHKKVLKLMMEEIFKTFKEGLQAEELYWQAMDEFQKKLKKIKPKHRLMHKSDRIKAEEQLEKKAPKLKKDVAKLNPNMSEQIYGYFCDAGNQAIKEAEVKQENKIKRRAAIGLAVASTAASVAFFPLFFVPGQVLTYIAIGSATASGLFGIAGVAAAGSIDKNNRSEDNGEKESVTLRSDLNIPLNFGIVKVPVKVTA